MRSISFLLVCPWESQSWTMTRVLPSSEAVTDRMRRTGRRDTAAELRLRSAMHALGLRYVVDQHVLPGLRRRADVVFTRARVAVFVHGCFWHGCPDHGTWPKANAEWWREKIKANQVRDRDTEARLTAAGWRVVTVWEHEEPRFAARMVAEVVRGVPR